MKGTRLTELFWIARVVDSATMVPHASMVCQLYFHDREQLCKFVFFSSFIIRLLFVSFLLHVLQSRYQHSSAYRLTLLSPLQTQFGYRHLASCLSNPLLADVYCVAASMPRHNTTSPNISNALSPRVPLRLRPRSNLLPSPCPTFSTHPR